jgi:large subunit ribosomal protein L10
MTKVGTTFRKQVVTTIKKGVEGRQSAFVVNYEKVGMSGVSSLRKTLQQKKAKMYASRGALASIALKEMKLDPLAEGLTGSTAFVWSDADPAEISKLLIKFAEKNEGFAIRGGVLNGLLLKKDDVKRLSDLPAKEVLLGQLLGTLQSPMTRLARALNGKTTELLLLLKQLSEKRGGN